MSGTNNFAKKYFLSTNWDNTNFHHFCNVRACRYSFKSSIFQKSRKIVEKLFLWWVEQIILSKNIFLAQIEIIQIFTIFVRFAPVDIPSKFNFPKIASNCLETLSLMSGTNNFAKKYFLSTNWDNTNFHHFCNVRACRYSFKSSIFQKSRKIVEKLFLWWVEQIILSKNIFLAQTEIIQIFTTFVRSAPVDIPSKIQLSKNCLKLWRKTSFDEWKKKFAKKYFHSTNWDNTNFHHFCKVRACRYSFKSSIFQKSRKIVEKLFLWWVEQIILSKNIFLAQIEIIQIFTIFVRSAPVDIPSKIQFSKNCLKLFRNSSFDEWNK